MNAGKTTPETEPVVEPAATDVVDVNVSGTTPQDDAIAELRALVVQLQAQVAAQGTNTAAGPMTFTAMLPEVGFDKGVGSHPMVVMSKNGELLDVQARHLHILEALGWELRGSSLERG
jgi:hypothetical protein